MVYHAQGKKHDLSYFYGLNLSEVTSLFVKSGTELFGRAWQVTSCRYICPFFFLERRFVVTRLVKGLLTTPKKGEECKELLLWNICSATVGNRDLDCMTLIIWWNVKCLFFLKIPLENIFWLIILSFLFCCCILFLQVVLLYTLPLFQRCIDEVFECLFCVVTWAKS